MLRLERHQQRAFLYECGRNIKRLFAAYCLEAGNDSYQKLTRDYKQRVVLKDAVLKNDTYRKLQALISIYNKVEAVDVNSPENEFQTTIKIAVTTERDVLKEILVNEANNALSANGSKPRDQQLVDFLYQFDYLDWYILDDKSDASYIEQIKQIRNALALEDLLVILKDEALLTSCFSALDCLSKKFIDFVEQQDHVSPLALLYLFEKAHKDELLKADQNHRPKSGLFTSFGDDQRIGEANLNTQELYLLVAAITRLQFQYEKVVSHIKRDYEDDYLDFKHAHKPIEYGKTLQQLSDADFSKLIDTVKAISKKYQDASVTVLKVKNEAIANNNFERAVEPDVEAVTKVQKPKVVNMPPHFGYYCYPNCQSALQRNAGDDITDKDTITELVAKANESLLADVVGAEKYSLVWDAASPLTIEADGKYNNLIRVKAVDAKINIIRQDNDIGAIAAQVEYTFEYTPSPDGESGTYKLIQIFTDSETLSHIYNKRVLDLMIGNRCIDSHEEESINELKEIESVKTRAKATEVHRLDELEIRYAKRNRYDVEKTTQQNLDKFTALTRDLPNYNQYQPLVDNVITDVTTAFNARFTSNKSKQQLVQVVQAVNVMLMHADKPESESYRHAVNNVLQMQQKIKNIAVMSAVTASLTMLAAAIVITGCVLLTVFTAGAGAAIGVPAIATGALKAGLLTVGGIGLFAGTVGKLFGVAAASKSHRHFKISNSLTNLVDAKNDNAVPAPMWRPS